MSPHTDALIKMYSRDIGNEKLSVDIEAMVFDVVGFAKLSISQGNNQTKGDFLDLVSDAWDAVEIAVLDKQ